MNRSMLSQIALMVAGLLAFYVWYLSTPLRRGYWGLSVLFAYFALLSWIPIMRGLPQKGIYTRSVAIVQTALVVLTLVVGFVFVRS